jgi:hypothetical protein
MFLPLILILIDGGVRPSISDYYYMDSNHWFVSLLTIASMIFANSGVVDNKKSYNIVLGVLLWVVAVTPYRTISIMHTLSAGIFFFGSVYVMIRYSNKAQRKYMWMIGSLIIFGMLGHFLFKLYSLFWAEWIGLLPISVHFIGESLGKIK